MTLFSEQPMLRYHVNSCGCSGCGANIPDIKIPRYQMWISTLFKSQYQTERKCIFKYSAVARRDLVPNNTERVKRYAVSVPLKTISRRQCQEVNFQCHKNAKYRNGNRYATMEWRTDGKLLSPMWEANLELRCTVREQDEWQLYVISTDSMPRQLCRKACQKQLCLSDMCKISQAQERQASRQSWHRVLLSW